MRALIAIFFLVLMSAPLEAAEIRIGLVPEQNVFKQVKRYEPLGKYIQTKTGIHVEWVILSRYGNIIDNFNKMKLDGAFWGSFTAVLAIKQLGVEHLARPVNLDGTSTYRGYILVRSDSGITDVKKMKGKTIAYVDKATTAGYVFPMAYFREHGVSEPDSFLGEAYFTGSHDAAVDALMNGEADIGCAKNTIYQKMVVERPLIGRTLTILAESPAVPSNGLGVKKELDDKVKESLRSALLGMHEDEQGKQVLKNFGVLRFIETTDADYALALDLATKAGLKLESYGQKKR